MMASKKFWDLIQFVPNDCILLETDSPFAYYNDTHSNTLSNIDIGLKK